MGGLLDGLFFKKKTDKQSNLNCKVEGEVHVTRWSKRSHWKCFSFLIHDMEKPSQLWPLNVPFSPHVLHMVYYDLLFCWNKQCFVSLIGLTPLNHPPTQRGGPESTLSISSAVCPGGLSQPAPPAAAASHRDGLCSCLQRPGCGLFYPLMVSMKNKG